jgi:hypothetical protein
MLSLRAKMLPNQTENPAQQQFAFLIPLVRLTIASENKLLELKNCEQI